MKKIVGLLRPFDLNQTFYIYEDGNCLEKKEFKMNEITDGLLNLAEKYSLTQIDFTGPKQFSRGIADQIHSAEMTKFQKEKLEINII